MSLQQPILAKAASMTPLLGAVRSSRGRMPAPSAITAAHGGMQLAAALGRGLRDVAPRHSALRVDPASTGSMIAENHKGHFWIAQANCRPPRESLPLSHQRLSRAIPADCRKNAPVSRDRIAQCGRGILSDERSVAFFGAKRVIGPLSLHLQFGNSCQTAPIRVGPLAVSAIFDPKPNRYGPRARLR